MLCPQLNKSVTAESCRGCDKCEIVRLDEPQGPYVSCRAARAPEPLPALVAQHLPVESVLALLLEPTKVSEVRSNQVVCADSELSARQLVELLLRNRYGGMPVVGKDGKPVGMVSKTDLLREGSESFAGAVPTGTVAEVMTESAFGLPEHASLAQAAALMAYERVHRVPILSDDGKVVGIVTPLDVARWLAAKAGYMVPNSSGH